MGAPQHTHTRCEVSFHSDSNFDGTLGLTPHPLLGSVVGVSTDKSFGGAAGSFSITLKKPAPITGSWAQLFEEPEGSWVRIHYLIDGEPHPILWGIVDSISENVTRSDQGARSETYTVTGRDFGKALEDTKTIVNLFAVGSLDIFRGLLSAYNFNPPIGSPDRVVKQILDLWLGNDGLGSQQYRLPSSLAKIAYAPTLYEALNFDTIQYMNEGSGETLDMTVMNPDQQSGQGLWDVLQQYNNSLLNEMWVDLAPTISRVENGVRKDYGWGPAFYLRERRFRQKDDTSLWDNTRLTVLERGDVRSRQLAKGGANNRYNYWVLHGGVLGDQYRAQTITESLGVEPFKPGAIPIVNIQSMQIHGIRPYVATTNFLPFFKGGEQKMGFVRLAANWMKRIHDWYGVAPWQLSGTLTTTRLRPDIRIGQRVRERRADGDVTFYVEGVSHSWSYPGPGSTTLTLTHGQYDTVVRNDTVVRTPLDLLYAQYEGQQTASKATSALVESEEPQPIEAQTQAPQKGKVVSQKNRPRNEAADTQMVSKIGSKDSQHAQKVATEQTTDPLPNPDKQKQVSGVALSKDDLESRVKINIPPNSTPKAPSS